jgi:uncharacterized protein (TIGR02391 family)
MIPDVEKVLALEPEELAGILLVYLKSLPPRDSQLNLHNFFHDPRQTFAEYPESRREDVANAFLAAWVWLQTEGLILPRVGAGHPDWVMVSRRGEQMATRENFAAYRAARLLPDAQLHGAIAGRVSATFTRGEYDTAVFQAFREVEIAVRDAGGFTDADYGVDLMRNAFDKNKGPLRDEDAVASERDAVAHLFAGAIGLFKNPPSHRSVTFSDPREVVEVLMLASLLLRIVDARAAAGA